VAALSRAPIEAVPQEVLRSGDRSHRYPALQMRKVVPQVPGLSVCKVSPWRGVPIVVRALRDRFLFRPRSVRTTLGRPRSRAGVSPPEVGMDAELVLD